MKKLTLASMLIAASFGASATSICTGTAGNGNMGTQAHVPGTNYMVVDISPKCSQNVYLQGEDGTGGAFYAVASASAKGKNTFGGSTNGGAVKPGTACAIPGGCSSDEVGTALTAAKTAAAGSGS